MVYKRQVDALKVIPRMILHNKELMNPLCSQTVIGRTRARPKHVFLEQLDVV